PEGGAVLGEREIERRVRQWNILGRCLDERKFEPSLRLHAPRRLELRRRRIDADRPRAPSRQPRGEVCGAAAELDDVETIDLADTPDLRLGDAEDAPANLLLAPVSLRGWIGELGIRLRP